MGIEGKRDLRAARSPALRAGDLISICAEGLDIDRRAAIHAGEAPPAEHGYLWIRLRRAISATAEMDGRLDRREGSVRCHSRTQTNHRGMAMTTGENVFGGVENQLYRPPGRFRQMVGDRHVDERRLGAEVAADIDDVNLDLLLRDAEILRHLVAQAPGTLVRGPDLDPPIPVNVNGAGAGLYVAVMGKGRAKRMLENPRRIRKPRLDIAVLPHDMRLQVMPDTPSGSFGAFRYLLRSS